MDLVRSWSFERPPSGLAMAPPSPKITRNVFSLEPQFRHRSSILIDMNVSSPSGSPPSVAQEAHSPERVEDGVDLVARKAGIGNLMKVAKKDVQIPEFDMNAFM